MRKHLEAIGEAHPKFRGHTGFKAYPVSQDLTMQRSIVGVMRALALLVATGVLLSGCSRPTGSITGTVSHNGKALKGGSVTFISTEGLVSDSGAIGDDGRYSVPQITSGKFKVCVDTSFLAPPTTGGPRGASGPITGAAPPPGALIPEGYKPSNPADAAIASNAKKFVKIPTKYKFEDQTDLSYEVKAGPQTYDIDLK